MAKILNLNDLSPKETREVQIHGKTYPIKEMSVEDFVETTRVAEEMEKETSNAKQIQATITLIKRSVPTLEDDVLKALTLDQLRGLTAFIRGATVDAILKANAEEVQADSGNV